MEAARRWASSLREAVTLEPMIAFFFIGYQIVAGAGVNTDLVFLKVCRFEMSHNDTVCSYLHRFESVERAVQQRANNFEIYRGLVGNVPGVFFGLIAGALSDRFGRKPLMVYPLLGALIANIVPILMVTFIDELPLEFLIAEELDAFFGGMGVFFIGVYGYGATISKTHDRAILLARYDGVESISQILGAALSPLVLKTLGFYGCYCLRAFFFLLALLYVKHHVEEAVDLREVKAREESGGEDRRWPRRIVVFFHVHVVVSVRDTFRVYVRKRPDHLRLLVTIQIFVYACYKFSTATFGLTYVYMKLAFGAVGAHYALFVSVLKGLQAFALLVLVPLMSRRLGLHDTVILGIGTLTHGFALLVSAFVPDLWSFLVCRWLTLMRMCQSGAGRSLMTRTVEPEEIGKVLSGFTVVSSVVSYVANVAVRSLYGATLGSFPSAFLVLASLLMLLASGLNFGLYTQRDKFRTDPRYEPEENDEEIEEEEMLDLKSNQE